MLRYIVAFSLIALALFPAYLLVVVTIDSLIGENLFLSSLLFGSMDAVTSTVLADWMKALPYCLAISGLMTLVSRWVPAHRLPTLFWSGVLALVVGLGAGFASEPLVGVSLGLALAIVSPLLCLRYRGT